MALKGDLASVDLAQVFQMLALNRKVGMLSIQSTRVWRALYFNEEGVTLYFNEHTLLDRILKNLVRSGRLVEETVQDASDHSTKMGISVMDSLLAGGFLTEQDLEDLYRSELEEEIYDLFFWTDARFEFFEKARSIEGREGRIDERLFFSTDSLIMEAARRIDEWSYIGERVPSPLEVFQQNGAAGQVTELDDCTLSIYDLVDGKRSVSRTVEVAALAPFHVFKSFATLLDKGMVQFLPDKNLVPTGIECMKEGRIADAINLFEKAISINVGLPGAHGLAYEAYKSDHEYELAVYHLKCLSEFEVGAGNIRQAIAHLDEAISLLPTDLSARERMVELSIGHPEFKTPDFDPMAQGKFLVDLYLEIGEVERVRGILERLLLENPDDLELKKILINVHLKAGDTKRVMDLYESMAKDLLDERRTIEAINYLQKIVRIDRSRTDISDRIRQLYKLDERRRSRKRSLFALGGLFVVLTALAAGYYMYDRHSWEQFENIDVSGFLAQKDFGSAEETYARFARTYPFTMAAREAESTQAQIISRRMADEARVQREFKSRETALAKIRARYEKIRLRHKEEFRRGDPEAALRSLEEIRTLVYEMAGESEDLQWAKEQKIDHDYEELKTYLAMAVALERKARQSLDKGDWRAAREVLVELVTKYEVTPTSEGIQLPVLIDSRPPGALIRKGGQPVTHKVDGRTVEVTTPAVVFCRHESPELLELVKDGFQPSLIKVNALQSESVVGVLTIVPATSLSFRDEIQTPVGAHSEMLAVGIKGGYLGIASANGTRRKVEIQLDDLAAVVSRPVFFGNRVYLVDTLGRVHCRRLDGRGVFGWPVRLLDDVAQDLVVTDGRVLLADVGGRLVCLNANTGKQLWSSLLNGQASTRPTVTSGRVWVGTRSGELLGLDATGGRVLQRMRLPASISTRIHATDSSLVFGCSDGYVRAIAPESGRVLWTHGTGHTVEDEYIAFAGQSLVVFGAKGRLSLIDMKTGTERNWVRVRGKLQHGLVASRNRMFLVLRSEERRRTKDRRIREDRPKPKDLLMALSMTDLSVLWQYQDGGPFAGPVTASGDRIFLPVSSGEVVVFK